MRTFVHHPRILAATFAAGMLGLPLDARAQQGIDDAGQVVLGIKISAGGRYDTVRLCVATGEGVKGGPAADVSFFTEIGIADRQTITVDVPVFRPIFFAAAFGMLQFEPEVTLSTRVVRGEDLGLLLGTGLGLTLHYGPDYTSPTSGPGRKPSFFAMGPRTSLYLGLDFPRPGEIFNFQLGLRPYLTALLGVDDPEDHRGQVLGGQLEGQFRLDPKP
jgi:hypothetical protein